MTDYTISIVGIVVAACVFIVAFFWARPWE